MRNFKRKMMVMCAVAMMCMSMVCFTACNTQTLVWGVVDSMTFASIEFGVDNIEEGETKDRVNQIINGIADSVNGVKGVINWVKTVVTPR